MWVFLCVYLRESFAKYVPKIYLIGNQNVFLLISTGKVFQKNLSCDYFGQSADVMKIDRNVVVKMFSRTLSGCDHRQTVPSLISERITLLWQMLRGSGLLGRKYLPVVKPCSCSGTNQAEADGILSETRERWCTPSSVKSTRKRQKNEKDVWCSEDGDKLKNWPWAVSPSCQKVCVVSHWLQFHLHQSFTALLQSECWISTATLWSETIASQ